MRATSKLWRSIKPALKKATVGSLAVGASFFLFKRAFPEGPKKAAAGGPTTSGIVKNTSARQHLEDRVEEDGDTQPPDTMPRSQLIEFATELFRVKDTARGSDIDRLDLAEHAVDASGPNVEAVRQHIMSLIHAERIGKALGYTDEGHAENRVRTEIRNQHRWKLEKMLGWLFRQAYPPMMDESWRIYSAPPPGGAAGQLLLQCVFRGCHQNEQDAFKALKDLQKAIDWILTAEKRKSGEKDGWNCEPVPKNAKRGCEILAIYDFIVIENGLDTPGEPGVFWLRGEKTLDMLRPALERAKADLDLVLSNPTRWKQPHLL